MMGAMPPRTDAFLASLRRCLAVPGFLSSFYDAFLASSPEVREKFAGVDMARQARVLEDSLYVVAVAVQGEQGSVARGELPRLAARHGRAGLDVRPELYDLWTRCLVDAAARHDPEWSEDFASAWRETLSAGVEAMRRGY
jgi:hemoglobin-like flavoprotein